MKTFLWLCLVFITFDVYTDKWLTLVHFRPGEENRLADSLNRFLLRSEKGKVAFLEKVSADEVKKKFNGIMNQSKAGET